MMDDKEKKETGMSEKEFVKRNFSHARENWHNAGFLKKILMIFLALVVGGGIVTALVLGIMGIFVVSGIIIGILLVFVPIVILIAFLVSKLHLSKKNINWDIPAKEGVVVACTLHTETSKTENGNDEFRGAKVKILTSIYQLKVEVEGKIKTTYDTKVHNAGDKVMLRQHKIFKSILIVE